jgi:Flp pilus assembly protein TadB
VSSGGPTDYSATPAPPAGEEIHLPGPTILPLVTAIAITLIVIGTTIWWLYSAVGGVIFVLVVIRWIRDTRRDIATLPEEHP